jgi:hypothetical protein
MSGRNPLKIGEGTYRCPHDPKLYLDMGPTGDYMPGGRVYFCSQCQIAGAQTERRPIVWEIRKVKRGKKLPSGPLDGKED